MSAGLHQHHLHVHTPAAGLWLLEQQHASRLLTSVTFNLHSA